MRTRIACVLLCAIAAAWCARAADQPPDLLASLRSILDRGLRDIEKAHADAVASMPTRYMASLDALREQRQKAGDFEGLMAVQAEIERLRRERTLPAQAVAGTPPELAAVQSATLKAGQEAALAKSRRVMDLVEKYVARLDTEKKRLTVAGDFNGALVYDAEIKRVRVSPEVTAAEFSLAAAETEKPPAPPPPPPPPDPQPANPASPQPANPPAAVDGRFKVYTEQTPPALAGVLLKRVTLRATPLSGLAGRVSASAMIGSRADMTRESSGSYGYSYSSRSGTVEQFVRLTLRTRSTEVVLPNAAVVVQYYTKSAGKTSGRIRPQAMRSERLRLPSLSSALTTIDFPSVGVSSYESRSSSYYYSSNYGYGDEFYGVVVTVLDADGAVAFQGVSNPTLEDCAQAALDDARQ